jgi:hypothetical protein
MFAILLSDQMDIFLHIIFSFPTVFFTFFLILSCAYWLLTLVGFVGIEAFDLGADGADGVTSVNVFSAMLFRLGLNGVPITIVISLISLVGWVLCFLVVFFIYPFVLFRWLQLLLGIPVVVAVLYVAALVTAVLIKPLRPIFIATNQEVQKQILGQVATVRTGEVNRNFGEAYVEDGGAGLIVKVRAYKDESFKRGDKIVLLEYVAGENVYRVISEADFHN